MAAIIPDGFGQEGSTKDLIVRYKGDALKRINDWNPLYQPLHYVLLFPHGELGWHPDIPLVDTNNNGKRECVTRTEYYAYYMHYRLNHPATLFLCKKLFHQYLVDNWAITEQSKLKWIEENQTTLRADSYKGLMDTLASDGGDNALRNLGKRVILPSGHANSTRFMYQLFQDSMAICRYYGHPDLFITFTANPQWKEVKDALLPGQDYTDRPDLVARVFQLKKEAFLRDLTVEGVVGKVVAHVHTIEFQKRGLPHMHLLVFLDPQDRIKCAEDIDCLIRADIPDPVTETNLYNIVTMVMLHGPCDSRCQGPTGKCTKGFPKPFRETTSIVENGYPQLRRPKNNRTHEKNNHVYDNTAVVPYCPYFSLKYNAHINCEACFSIKAVKYIHKYIYKGHDRTTMVLGQGNEVQQYLDSRYIAAPESVWRILGFNVHNEEPTVYRLPIHLEYKQTVTFDEEGADLDRTLYRAENTLLTHYFKANGDPVLGETVRSLLYHEFSKEFVWVNKDRIWKF